MLILDYDLIVQCAQVRIHYALQGGEDVGPKSVDVHVRR